MKLTPVTFSHGQTIIEKNLRVTCGYLFMQGEVDVLNVNSHGISYVYVTDYKAQFVGLMEIYSNHERYCCTVRVEKKCIGYRINREDLFELLDTCDCFKTYLIEFWANQFYESSINESRYPIHSSMSRLTDYLLHQCDQTKDEIETVRLTLKREELAEIMGCSKRTVFRLLSQLKKQKILGTERTVITISPLQRKQLIKMKEADYEM